MVAIVYIHNRACPSASNNQPISRSTLKPNTNEGPFLSSTKISILVYKSEWEALEEVIRQCYVHETAETDFDQLRHFRRRDGET